jgi:hypothetical protein
MFHELINYWETAFQDYTTTAITTAWRDAVDDYAEIGVAASEILFNTYYKYLYHVHPLYVCGIYKDCTHYNEIDLGDHFYHFLAESRWEVTEMASGPAGTTYFPYLDTDLRLWSHIFYKDEVKLCLNDLIHREYLGVVAGDNSNSAGVLAHLPNLNWIPRKIEYTLQCGPVLWAYKCLMEDGSIVLADTFSDDGIRSLAGIDRHLLISCVFPPELRIYVSHAINTGYSGAITEGFSFRLGDYAPFINENLSFYGMTNQTVEYFNAVAEEHIVHSLPSGTRYSQEGISLVAASSFVNDVNLTAHVCDNPYAIVQRKDYVDYGYHIIDSGHIFCLTDGRFIQVNPNVPDTYYNLYPYTSYD